MDVLKVEDLHKSYRQGFFLKSSAVLFGVNFRIEEGKITGFLGGNGAGKTTTMKCLLGLSRPDTGKISFFDDKPLSKEVLKSIGYLPERPYFYDYLTGEEFLQFYGQLSGTLTRNDLQLQITTLLERLGLSFARQKRLRDYSKGMLQKIGLAQALIHRPRLLILDEPMSGLDPDGRQLLKEIILETSKEGTSIFFSSHLLHDAEILCDGFVVIAKGKIIYQGNLQGIINEVQTEYEISFRQGQDAKTLTVKTLDEIQIKLVELIQRKCEILQVTPSRMSLEEAFVKLALRPDPHADAQGRSDS